MHTQLIGTGLLTQSQFQLNLYDHNNGVVSKALTTITCSEI